jgi:hypothetical protein
MFQDALQAAGGTDPAALNAAARHADGVTKLRRKLGDHIVFPSTEAGEIYFDDNAWLVLTYHELSTMRHHDVAAANVARETLDFTLTGHDQTLGGGVWWLHERRETKNTCSTAPTILACLRMYKLTNEPRYRDEAMKMYDWVNQTLQDTDGLFFDSINLKGEINKTKFSYNSGVMVMVNVELFRHTAKVKYYAEAIRIAKAGVDFWMKGGQTGVIYDDAQFARWWVEAMLDLHTIDQAGPWLTYAKRSAQYILDNKPPNGLYPKKFDAKEFAAGEMPRLMDQAARARILFMVAKASAE